jgi:NTP pyrophosphatase (non-canonical NTP hydrolase)
MDWLAYSSKAIATVNKELDWKDRVTNAALGLTGESGEVADIVKKSLFQGHELNIEKIKKELGDILWYLNLMADCIGIDLEDIARANIDKLYSRYENGTFSSEQSVNRKS